MYREKYLKYKKKYLYTKIKHIGGQCDCIDLQQKLLNTIEEIQKVKKENEELKKKLEDTSKISKESKWQNVKDIFNKGKESAMMVGKLALQTGKNISETLQKNPQIMSNIISGQFKLDDLQKIITEIGPTQFNNILETTTNLTQEQINQIQEITKPIIDQVIQQKNIQQQKYIIKNIY